MKNDNIILEVIKRGFVTVDFKRGIVYSNRPSSKWCGKKIGFDDGRDGYRVTTLCLDGSRRRIRLHRLIWIAKFGLPAIGLQVDHKNRNKSDNRLSNLRLVTNKENANNRRSFSGSANPAAKINYNIVCEIRRKHRATGYSHSKIAREFNVSKSLVGQIVRGQVWANL